MSDKAFVVAIAIAIAIAIAFGFIANCEKTRITTDAEVQKARIEKGLEK